MRHPDLLADVEHRRLVALALADDDRAVDRDRVHLVPHGFDGDLVRLVPIALSHRVGAGNRGLLDDTQEVERQVRVEQRWRIHGAGFEVVVVIVSPTLAARSASVGPSGSRAGSRPA